MLSVIQAQHTPRHEPAITGEWESLQYHFSDLVTAVFC